MLNMCSIEHATRRHRTLLFAVAAGLLAALPSLLWAASGSGLIVDDWTHAAESHDSGVWGHFWATGFSGNPRRPGAGAWYATTFGLFGQHPVGHALALAALNF